MYSQKSDEIEETLSLEEREKELSRKFGWIIMDEADQLSKDGDLGPQVEQILRKDSDFGSLLREMDVA